MDLKEELISKMIKYDEGMTKQIHHFLKVYEFAHLIGVKENLDEETLLTLDLAAILHDIGIKKALEIYGSSMGKYQEELGPEEALILMKGMPISGKMKERICYLIGHHHTYTNITGSDYQILIEADFLVNLYEDNETKETILKTKETIFKTATGKALLKECFGL